MPFLYRCKGIHIIPIAIYPKYGIHYHKYVFCVRMLAALSDSGHDSCFDMGSTCFREQKCKFYLEMLQK